MVALEELLLASPILNSIPLSSLLNLAVLSKGVFSVLSSYVSLLVFYYLFYY